MDEERYKELYDIFKEEIIKGRNNTIEELRIKYDDRVLKIDAKYSTISTNLGGNSFKTDLSPAIYEQQQANIEQKRQEEYGALVKDGSIARKNIFIKEEFDDAPERIKQFEKDIADDPDLQWLKDSNQKGKEQEIDEWEELDTVIEEEVNEGFPGDEEGDSTQNQENNRDRDQINLQSEFPGFDVGEPSDINSIQPDHNPSNGNPGKQGPDIEPS